MNGSQNPEETKERRLEVLESRVHQCARKVLEMTDVLQEIMASRLHSIRGYESFDRYCDVVWGIKKHQLNRYLEASETLKRLSTIGDVHDLTCLSSEGQLRELIVVPAEKLARVLDVANDMAVADGRKPNHFTARDLRSASKRVMGSRARSRAKRSSTAS